MGKKTKTALGLILPAIGAGLVYVSYNSSNSISADSPYAESNPVINIVLILLGILSLLIGIMVLIQVFTIKSK